MQNYNTSLYAQPIVSGTTQQDPVIAKHDNAMWDLTKQLSKLPIKIINNKPKWPQPTIEQHNVWCRNCKDQGHLAYECPTPKGFKIGCISCGGNHALQKCWNFKQQKIVNQGGTNQYCTWQQEWNGHDPSANYNPKRNFNLRFVP